MRRKNKYKIRRTIIVLATLLLILFGVFLIIEKIKNDKLPHEKHQEEESTNNQNEQGEEETSVEPEPVKEEPEEPENPEEYEEPETEQAIDDPEYGIIIENPEKLDVMVNKTRNLPENYVPEDLVTLTDLSTVLSNPEVNQLRKAAYEALRNCLMLQRKTVMSCMLAQATGHTTLRHHCTHPMLKATARQQRINTVQSRVKANIRPVFQWISHVKL